MNSQNAIRTTISKHSKKCVDINPPCRSITHFNWFARFENNEYRKMKPHSTFGIALVGGI